MGENDLSGKVGLDYSDFQRGVSALNQQIKNIEVSFRGSAATMDDWSSTSEGLQLRIGSLNEKLELQKTKLKALSDEFNLLSTSEGDHTKEQQQLAGQMATLEKQIGATQGEIKKYSTSLDQMEGNADGAGTEVKDLGNNMDDAKKKTSVFGDVLKANFVTDAVRAGISAIGGAIKGLVSGLLGAGTSAAAYADDVSTLATQTGLATDTIQGMSYAANILDVDVDTQARGMAKVTAAIGDATEAGADYITATGGLTVSIKDANGDLKSTEQVYYDTIDALGDMTDETARETAAQDLFGRSYQDLMPLIAAGSEGLKEFTAEAEANGYILSNDALTSLNDYQDSLDRLSNGKTAFTNALGVVMAPAMQVFADSATDASSALTQLVNGSIDTDEFSEKISGIVTNLSDKVNEDLPALMTVAESILGAIGDGIITALPTLATAAADIVVQLGNSIVDAIPTLITTANQIITELVPMIVQMLPAITIAGWQIIAQIAESIIENLPQLTEAALQVILQLATGLADSLPELIPTIVDVVIQIVETLIDNIDLLTDASIAIIIALAVGLTDALPKLIEKAPEIIKKLVAALIEAAPQLFQAAVTLVGTLAAGIIKELGAIALAAAEIVSTIGEKIKNLPAEALQWGKDIVNGIAKGIKDAASAVGDAVEGVAQNIWDFLHFSEPDKGPLSDFHTYMPDMMRLLAYGITSNLGVVTNAASKAGGAISNGLAGGIEDSKDEVLTAATNMSNELLKEETRLQGEIATIQAKTQENIVKSDEDIQEEALKSQLKLVQDFKQEYDNAIADVQKSQDNLAEKLVSFGDLFTRTQSELGGTIELSDLQDQIDAINTYGDSLEELKKRGVSDSLLEEIQGMSIEDATEYTQQLLGMTDKDYAKYMSLWDEKQKTAQRVAENYYKGELDSLKTEYVDKIPDELGGLKDKMSTLGENSAKGLASGFELQEGYITSSFTTVLENALNSAKSFLGIASPSKLFRDELGVNLAQGVGVGFSDEMQAVSQQMNKAIPTSFDTPTAQTQSNTQIEGMVNGLAGLLGNMQLGGGTYQINVNIDGKTAASVLYNPLTDIFAQKGVSLA